MIVVCLECDVSHLLKDLGTEIKLKTNKQTKLIHMKI